jgi:TM2 domain-containing membrane protein YozV
MAQCVTCGASLPPGGTRCLKCGTVADVVASPAQQSTQSAPQQPQVIYVQQQPQPQVQVPQSTKSKGTAAVLAILLGGLGAHKFYLGQPVWGVIYLIFCWTFVPEALGIIEGIIYLTMSDASFAQKYNK